MSIIVASDFTGRYAIPLNPEQTTDLTAMITYVENEYLPTLFGVTLYDLFIADLTGTPQVPQSARFLTVFNALMYQDSNGPIYKSEGIKEMLKGLTYFHYLRDRGGEPTTGSFSIPDSANSERISALHAGITSRYNQGVDTYRVIQDYMLSEDSATYPEFEGVNIEYTIPL